jgi:hypothetical protein
MSEARRPLFRADRRIVLVGSMGVYGTILEVAAQFAALDIEAVVPDAEGESMSRLSLFEYEEFKRRVSFAYLRKIRDPRTYGVLAVNVDRHGILNYIGPNTFAELAVAFAQSKRIYLYQGMPDAYAEELSAWRGVVLNGRINQLVDEFSQACMKEHRQLPLIY